VAPDVSRSIALEHYPFRAVAIPVNVFFASLIGSWVGLLTLSLVWSIGIGAVIGVPVTLAFACHIRRLMDKAQK
jgi:hypothetical protein